MNTGDARRRHHFRALAALLVFALGAALVAVPATAVPSGTIRLEARPGGTLPGTGNGAIDMEVADIDNDLDRDVVLVTSGTQRLMTFLNDGSGGFTLTENRALVPAPTSVAVLDFDGDGKQDFAWGDTSSSTNIAFGDGAGRADATRLWPSTGPLGTAPITDLEVIDANADGWPDLVHAEPIVDTVRVLFNGGGSFAFPASYALPPNTDPGHVAVGFLDANTSQDFAVIGYHGGLYLYTNGGTGSFTQTASSPLPTGPSPTGVTIDWLDDDDRQDIATCDFADDDVQVYLAGSGTSFTRKDYPAGDQPVAIAADWIGTGGESDLAVACEQDGTIAFLENDGSGGFTSAGTVDVPSPTDVALELADNDFKSDVFALRSDRLHVFANTSKPTTRRYAGPTRYETAVEISEASWPNGTQTVVVATGELFPDALAGTPLATALGAPILLTRSDALPPAVAAEVTRLGATEAVILGGTGAVSEDVRAQIEAAGVPASGISRIGGADRYETAHLIALALQDAVPTTDVTTAFVATGEDFPDALAGGAFAAAEYGPIVLVRRDEVPAASEAVFTDLPSITDAYVLGGEGVVSAAVAARFPNPTRLAGPDRYGTSRAIAEAAIPAFEAQAGLLPLALAVATGEDFPDALAIGPHAARYGGPVLLTRSQSLPPDTRVVVADYARHVLTVRVAGGTGAVSEAVAAEMEAAY